MQKQSADSRYKAAIEKGKVWMQRSKDPMHNAPHAASVEKMGLIVYGELVRNKWPGIEYISPELVKIVAWWHDCYKATLDDFSVAANFTEGPRSREIADHELQDLLAPEELKLVLDAIERHAGMDLIPYAFLGKSRSPLHKILIEADAYELINIDRIHGGYLHFDTLLEKLWIFVDLSQSLIIPLYLKTAPTRKAVFKRLWKYWGIWFWDKWYFFKLMFGHS